MKKHKINYFSTFMIFMTSLLISCNTTIDQSLPLQQSNKKDCRIIEHKMGKTEICGQPERIVVLGPYLLESLLALNVQPIAYADHIGFHQRDYDRPTEQIPYLGKYINQSIANVGVAYMPSMEAIFKTKPDLILSLDDNQEHYQTLSRFAPILMFSWNEPNENLKKIAQAVNRKESAEKILEETAKKIAKAKDELAKTITDYPDILLLYAQDLQELFINNNRGLCSSLVKELGFNLITISPSEASSNQRIPLSLEVLPQLNAADSIIILGYDFQEPSEFKNAQEFNEYQLSNLQQQWLKNPITQSMGASQADRVYYVPAYLCIGLPGSISTELYLNELKKQLLTHQKS
ncbi:iron-siderophore ABC transporter substrate-binding protein [Synechocystis sp. PCC 7339]|nr:iron-siderophore ABC transporter substrate-binding protein [Synechocystis sp. PCC 7339]